MSYLEERRKQCLSVGSHVVHKDIAMDGCGGVAQHQQHAQTSQPYRFCATISQYLQHGREKPLDT